MLILIISDIHANITALESVLSAAGEVDGVWCLGDLVGYGPDPNECVERVRQLPNLVCLIGNHDAAIVNGSYDSMNPQAKLALHYTRQIISDENMEYLNTLSKKLTIQVEDVIFCVYHGSPLFPLKQYVYPWTPKSTLRTFIDMVEGDILILGHTHIPMLFNFNNKLLINPGSVGQPRDKNPQASYMILQIEDTKINVEHHRVDYNVDVVMSKIIEVGLPTFLAHRLKRGV